MTSNGKEQDQHNYPHHTEQGDGAQARAYHVEDDDNLEEKDLKRSYLFGDSKDADPDQPGYESHGNGGESFGKSNVTTSGDDSANPSQNAGYSNDYFKRTEPSEEHPENSNFKPADQQTTTSETMQEGTADYDGGTQRNQADNANPDQNKVGDSHTDERDHIES